MSASAIEKAREFAWDKKAEKSVEIYEHMVREKTASKSEIT